MAVMMGRKVSGYLERTPPMLKAIFMPTSCFHRLAVATVGVSLFTVDTPPPREYVSGMLSGITGNKEK